MYNLILICVSLIVHRASRQCKLNFFVSFVNFLVIMTFFAVFHG